MHRGLGRGVGEHARKRHKSRHRAEIDDGAALPALDQIAAEHLAAQEHALVIDAHDAVELVLGDVEEGRGRIHAGAVHDDVDAAGLPQDLGQQSLERGLLAGLAGMEIAAAARRVDALQLRLGLLLVAAHEHNLAACAGQTLGHGAAELAGAANDDGDLAVQFIKIREISR